MASDATFSSARFRYAPGQGRGVTRRGLKASIGSAYVRKNGHVEWNEARFETLLSLSIQLYSLVHPVCSANCNNEFEPELKRWRKFNGG